MILSKTVVVRGKEVKVEDLSPCTNAKVDVMCPECKAQRSVFYKSVRKAGHTVCQACSMKKRTSLLDIGARYEMLTILQHSERTGYSLCRCDCGHEKEISNRNILTGQRSCGCARKDNFVGVNRPKGEAHGRWKGGVSSIRERVASSKAYKDWRREVLSTGFCKKCGTTENVHACHVLDFQHNEELRISVENGVALCLSCHNKFHATYGRKNNTEFQMNEFLRGKL